MHPDFAQTLNLSQVKHSNTQIYTIHSYIAEKYYFAEVNAALLLCWAIPSINTFFWYTLP